MENNAIRVAVIELTNISDIDRIYFPKIKVKQELDYRIVKKFLDENEDLEPQIQGAELGVAGDAILHSKIKDILNLFLEHDVGVNINTNGLKIKDFISSLDNDILANINITMNLDSPDEKKNDYMMGHEGLFKKTIEAMEYLSSKNIHYDLLMHIISLNCMDVISIFELSKFYKCNMFIPMETFPFMDDKHLLLSDKDKAKVISDIKLIQSKNQSLILRGIHFVEPPGNCSHLRKERIFISSEGKLSFCHFLYPMKNTEICDLRKKSLLDAIKLSNSIRDKFVKRKSEEMKSWKRPRETSSPCSYCIYRFGAKDLW